MKKAKFSESQIVAILKEGEAGVPAMAVQPQPVDTLPETPARVFGTISLNAWITGLPPSHPEGLRDAFWSPCDAWRARQEVIDELRHTVGTDIHLYTGRLDCRHSDRLGILHQRSYRLSLTTDLTILLFARDLDDQCRRPDPR